MEQIDLEDIFDLLSETGYSDTELDYFLTACEKSKRDLQIKIAKDPQFADDFVRITNIDIVTNAQFKNEKFIDRFIDEDDITKLISTSFQLPFKKIDPSSLDFSFLGKFFSKNFAKRNIIVPISETTETVTFAINSPPQVKIENLLKSMTSKKIQFALCSKTSILNVIVQYWNFDKTIQQAKKKINSSRTDSSPRAGIRNLERLVNINGDKELDDKDEEVVRTVEYILKMALDMKASDIHLELKRSFALIRMRIDGILHQITKLPAVIFPSVLTRIKILAAMNIAEKRRPQDGRIKVQNQNEEIEIRVSTIPTAFGEKAVLRIFDSEMSLNDPQQLGFEPEDYERLLKYISRTTGVIYLTGPTGSGKTTSLYSILRMLYEDSKNIVTIEDPIEMVYEDFNQTNVNPQIDLTFSTALRAILRQDPDIVMVGETRDSETARSVVQAAITGHLVFSTLHTNDTTSALTRLIELGVEPFLISSSVSAVIAQRLIRKICNNCKRKLDRSNPKHNNPLSLFHIHDEIDLYEGEGCNQCRNTGYKGRTGIFEMLEINEMIMGLVKSKADSNEIKEYAIRNGLKTLQDQGINKVRQGITSIDEVIRVAGVKLN